jgi:4-hydroxy-tetrahydrodipicolinate synthase
LTAAAPIAGGVFAAVLTPLQDGLSPDHRAFARHCRWLLANGCDGLAVLGTTGEANSFSLAERLRMLEGLIEAGIPGRALLPGTGCCALAETIELSRRAVRLGAQGVVMLPPFYYKNVTDDGLFAAYSEVIEKVGDDALKVYLYHFPRMSGVPISLALIERLLARYPATVAGIKDSSGDIGNMTACLRAFPGFAVFSGADDLLLPLLEAGGAGCITAVCNVASRLAAKVYSGWRNATINETNAQLVALRGIFTAYPLIAALKEVMARHGGQREWRNIRPPLAALGKAQAQALLKAVEATGFSLSGAR